MLEKVVIVKLAIGFAAAVFGLLLVGLNRFQKLSEKQFLIESLGLMVASRLALFLALFVVAHQTPQSDVLVYYDWAKPMLHGGLPYRDNESCYAPLFSHLTAAPLLVWDNPLAIVLVAMALEILSVPVWLAVGRRTVGERVARVATLLTIANAIAWFCSSVSGVNQSWMTLLIGLSILALLKSRPLASGLWLGASMIAVKFISLLYVPAFFFTADRRGRWWWAGGFGVLTVAVYGGFAPFCDVLYPFKQMSVEHWSGNVPFILSAVGVPFEASEKSLPVRIVTLAGLAALGWVLVAAIRNGAGKRMADLVPWCALLTLTVMIVSRKSACWYVAIVTFPICAAAVAHLGRTGAAVTLGLLGVIAMPESSLYPRVMHGTATRAGMDFRVLWSAGPSSALFAKCLVILALNVAQVALYTLLAWASWRTLIDPPAASAGPVRTPTPSSPSLQTATA